MNQNRSHYRTELDSWRDLEVTITRGDDSFPTEVLDVSGGGMQVAFAEDTAPALELGSTVEVQLSGDGFTNPMKTVAAIVRCETDDERRMYGLQFLDWMGLTAAMPKSVAPLFNLRADRRLAINPAYPLEVVVRDFNGSFSLRGMIYDISRGGMSFSTELLSQCILNRVDELVVEFQPNGSDRNFTFGCRVCYRSLYGEALRYGLWFDSETTYDFAAQQKALGEYIDQRLDAVLEHVFAQTGGEG